MEAAGHYHRPLTASGLLPAAWVLIELNPAHVTDQRRVLGKRGVKTDQVDLVAMFDLLVAGRGHPAGRRDAALLELQAWTALRFRRITAVIAAKNQLLGQMDRAFPGAGASWAPACATPGSAGWCWPSSPTPTGSPRWAWNASAASPPGV